MTCLNAPEGAGRTSTAPADGIYRLLSGECVVVVVGTIVLGFLRGCLYPRRAPPGFATNVEAISPQLIINSRGNRPLVVRFQSSVVQDLAFQPCKSHVQMAFACLAAGRFHPRRPTDYLKSWGNVLAGLSAHFSLSLFSPCPRSVGIAGNSKDIISQGTGSLSAGNNQRAS